MAKHIGKLFHFSSLQPTQWFSIAIFAVNALFNIVLACLYGVSLLTFVFLVFGTTTTVILDKLNRHHFENKVLEHLNKTRYDINDLECIGDMDDGIDWLNHNVNSLHQVFNTVFTRSSDDYTTASQGGVARYMDLIRRELRDGCQWVDLYAPGQKAVIEQFRATLSPEQLKKYHSHEADASLPMFQYSVFRYKDKREAVIFGWGFEGGADGQSQVFVSHGPRTVAFFTNHFLVTRRLCKPDARPTQAASLTFNPQPG